MAADHLDWVLDTINLARKTEKEGKSSIEWLPDALDHIGKLSEREKIDVFALLLGMVARNGDT